MSSMRKDGSVKTTMENSSGTFYSHKSVLNTEDVLKNVEQLIVEGRELEASVTSYYALISLCEIRSDSVSTFLNNLVYGPSSKSVSSTIMLLDLLRNNGFPPSCVDQLAVLPLSIIYNIPQGIILENDSLVQAVFNFIEKLLSTALTATVSTEKLNTLYFELNTFFSELSKALAENRDSIRFRKLFAQVEDTWVRLASTLFSNNESST